MNRLWEQERPPESGVDDLSQKLCQMLDGQQEILKGQAELKKQLEDQHEILTSQAEIKQHIVELKTHQDGMSGDLKTIHKTLITEIEEEFADIACALDLLAELTLQLSGASAVSKKHIEARVMTPQTQKILKSFGFLQIEEALRGAVSQSCSSDAPSSDNSSASPAGTPGGDTPRTNRRRHRPRRLRSIQSNPAESHHSLHAPGMPEVPEEKGSPASVMASVVSKAVEKRRLSASPCFQKLRDAVPVAEVRRMNEKQLIKAGSGTESEESDTGTGSAPKKQTSLEFDSVLDSKASRQDVPEPQRVLVIKTPQFWCSVIFRVAHICLRAGGIHPWTKKWRWASLLYRTLPLLLSAGFLATCMLRMTKAQRMDQLLSESNDTPAMEHLVTDFILGCSAFFAPASLGVRLRVLKERHADTLKLQAISQRRGFSGAWITQTSYDFLILSAVWIASVAERTRAMIVKTSSTGLDRLHVALFACASANLLCCAFSILTCSRGMTCMVDGFLLSVLRGRSLAHCEHSWKLRMALMRRVCSRFERCCILLALTATVAAFTMLVDMANGYRLELIPHIILVIYFPLVFWQMAAVTDVCKRVPPTVNSVICHTESGNDALYLVQFIQASEAGFYVYDTLLARGLVQKFVYFTCVALFAASTNVFMIRF